MLVKSNNMDQFIPAFIAARSEMQMAHKSAKGNHGAYSNIVDCLDAVIPCSLKHGLMVTQHVSRDENGEKILVTHVGHASNQFMESYMPIAAEQNTNGRLSSLQEEGKAITYLKRYTLLAIFCIAGHDDDNDGATSTASYSKKMTHKKPIIKQISHDDTKISKQKLDEFLQRIDGLDGMEKLICSQFKIQSLEEMTYSNLEQAIGWIDI